MSQSKPEEENSKQNPRITWEGCSVLLDINDGDRLVFARLTPGSYDVTFNFLTFIFSYFMCVCVYIYASL